MRVSGAEGHIVNISSTSGRHRTSGVYGATKAAVDHIAITLRQELKNDSIRIVNVIPGPTATNCGRYSPSLMDKLFKAAEIDEAFVPDQHYSDTFLEEIRV